MKILLGRLSVRSYLVLVVLGVLCSCGGGSSETQLVVEEPLLGPSYSFMASVGQGFNFQKDSQELIGHIDSMKIGDTVMDSDFVVVDPVDPANMKRVFGVSSGIYWKGGYAEPVTFAAQVSNGNKSKLATLQHKSLSNTDIEYSFSFYDYDQKTESYYKCFHSNGIVLKGLVIKQGGELALNMATDQSFEVVSPMNFTFQLAVMPQDIAQEIHLAFSSTDKLIKQWGVPASAKVSTPKSLPIGELATDDQTLYLTKPKKPTARIPNFQPES